jgi:hypothetical protein
VILPQRPVKDLRHWTFSLMLTRSALASAGLSGPLSLNPVAVDVRRLRYPAEN